MNLEIYTKRLRQQGKRYFTLDQLMGDLDLSKNAALVKVYRAKIRGDLVSPARGLYVIVPPEYQPQGCIPAEELIPILMHYLQADYYVSLLSGAQYHGATHQRPGYFQVISNKRIKHPLILGQIKIEFTYKQSLLGLPIENTVVSTGYLKIATPELVTLDLLLYPEKSGGLNHIATVLSELIEGIDAEKLIMLATQFKENAWLQRLGYILEKIDTMDEIRVKFIIDAIEKYLHGKMKNFVPLASEISKAGYPYIKKWMIIENTEIESDL